MKQKTWYYFSISYLTACLIFFNLNYDVFSEDIELSPDEFRNHSIEIIKKRIHSEILKANITLLNQEKELLDLILSEAISKENKALQVINFLQSKEISSDFLSKRNLMIVPVYANYMWLAYDDWRPYMFIQRHAGYQPYMIESLTRSPLAENIQLKFSTKTPRFVNEHFRVSRLLNDLKNGGYPSEEALMIWLQQAVDLLKESKEVK